MLADLRFALRVVCRTPGLTLVALACLAVAIGLTTGAFTVVHGAFGTPLPVDWADRPVVLREYDPVGRFEVPGTASRLTRLLERGSSFESFGAWYTRNVTLATGPGSSAAGDLVRAAYVSPNALSIVGLAPVRGRLPSEDDVWPSARRPSCS